MNSLSPPSSLVQRYLARTPKSAALAEKARTSMPSGLSHDGRMLQPYPPYVQSALGSRKRDVDGNNYVDYFGGHGSLILGHNHPAMVEAVHEQLSRGTHFGACHDGEVAWAEAVKGLIPSAELVRFTASGTEATLLAVRVARAVTGRDKIVRIRGHFHGWNDHMTTGYVSHFDGTPTLGVVKGVADNVVLVNTNDIEGLRKVFATNEIAAAIVEPTGAHFGRIPLSDAFLHEMRQLTSHSSALLIFDEVVTGFRASPGGYQSLVNITPDLTTLAKILAGGLPGGALAGRADVLDSLDFRKSQSIVRERLSHQGTYNANPLSSAAGIATLREVAGADVVDRASATADSLRRKLNVLFEAEGAPWAAYGAFSGFHIFTNPAGRSVKPTAFDTSILAQDLLGPSPAPHLNGAVRVGLLAHGVDVNGHISGWVSATHDEEDVEETVNAFRAVIQGLRSDHILD